jgi:single-strand DNA-binding protein
MASYNRVVFLGNLTRDPQLKFLPSQMQVVEFGLAMNHKYKTASGESREEVCFVDCAAFGRLAEIINQYCRKGRPLLVEGRLKYDTWEDKQGGGKRHKHSVVVENFQLLGSRDDAQGGGGGGYSSGGDEGRAAPRSAPGQRGPSPERAPVEQPFGEEQQFSENDIPF